MFKHKWLSFLRKYLERRASTHNETWEFPFVWQITDAIAVNGSTHMLELSIKSIPITDATSLI